MKFLQKLLLSILTVVALTLYICHAAAAETGLPDAPDTLMAPGSSFDDTMPAENDVQNAMLEDSSAAGDGPLAGLLRQGEQGEIGAQLQLGNAYYYGKGTRKNLEQAFFWYENAAQQGHPAAQRALGAMYKLGKGTARNPGKAAYWYEKAAAQGYAMAQTNLGILYETGEGVAQNYDTARFWYEKAAAQNDARAQTQLGIMYEKGRGVARDYETARAWYAKAAEQGYAKGQTYLGRMFELGVGTAVDFTQAFHWYRQATAQGDARAQTNLGALYETGQGVAQDYGQAVVWYSEAAAQDYPRGQTYLGRMFEQGLGVEKDPARAAGWYAKAAALGYGPAREELARMKREPGNTEATTAQKKQKVAVQAQDAELTAAEPPPPPAALPAAPIARQEVVQVAKIEVPKADTPLSQADSMAAADWQTVASNTMGSLATPVELDGIIEPFVIIDIGTPVDGVVQDVMVERSNIVKAGQLLLQLDSSVEKALVNKARSRAGNYGEIEMQKEKLAFAERAHDRIDDLYTKKAISNQKKDEAYTEVTVARQRLQKAEEEQQLAEMELKQAQALLAQRSIKSPISGIVLDRYISQGEFVDSQPLLRIAQIDPLRVEVIVPSHMFGKIKPGMKAAVLPELQEFGSQTATVTIVDRVIDAASNSFAVRLEIPNPDYTIPSGLKCSVRFVPDVAPALATINSPGQIAVPAGDKNQGDPKN